MRVPGSEASDSIVVLVQSGICLRSTPARMSKAEKEARAAELPVITEPQAMFTDMVARSEPFLDFARKLKRPLRVATMCSGTESPLLALEMISKACSNNHGVNFEVEHVFSCEIEPFKQGYIERNFAPPILFRDIRELGDEKAFTAYGAYVEVPGDVDLLVAGTSCVDYSNLNNQKQDIDAKGESGQTFRGMMSWVEKNQPPIVILENVCSAPWAKVQQYFEDHGYAAKFLRLDTKQYYIPHTRTRVYLVAYNMKTCANASEVALDWGAMVKDMERPSSSTLEAFLLPTDDPRVHHGRERLAIPKDRGAAGTDWSRCESRHQRARIDEALGTKRPYTTWEAQGACKLPDYAWSDWAKVQTERVLDLLDIDYLRLAAKDVDSSYKTLVWNLSQNVDRTTGSVKPGICPCLTPSMVPFVTNRGGPLIGLEALSLQGIPVDDLMLTRQSEDQMADLAGNAMTSTVVGTCMMAALILGRTALPAKRPGTRKRPLPANVKERQNIHVETKAKLATSPLALDVVSDKPFSELLKQAAGSARQCACEGREGMSADVHKCKDCHATACAKCRGIPEHNFEGNLPSRVHPASFQATLKAALPMRLSVEGLDAPKLCRLKPKGVDESVWTGWMAALGPLNGAEFCFSTVKRGTVWTAVYTKPTSPNTKLELVLDPSAPRWQISVEPPRERGQLRDSLCRPVVRCSLPEDGATLGSTLEVFVPHCRTFDAKITGCGDLVDTWQASLGLKNEFEGEKRYNQWQIDIPKEECKKLGMDLSGTYTLLDKCGHAANSLHKRNGGSQGPAELFFFLDPSRCGPQSTDHFCFATSHRRYWVPVTLHCPLILWPEIGIVKSALGLSLTSGSCASAAVVLHCKVPLTEADGLIWPENKWSSLNLERSKSTFDSLAWLTERLSLPPALHEWNFPKEPGQAVCAAGCQCCAPSQPQMRWLNVKGKVMAREDLQEAAEYECRIKTRPSPFVVRLKRELASGIGEMEIAVNSSTLVNRAVAELPKSDDNQLVVSWRIVPHNVGSALDDRSLFTMKSNRDDKAPSQPPHFTKFPLRPEQLRSLGWMLQQEATTEPYIEEEVSEAILPALGWRAEGRAQRKRMIRGGVLADQVGYGKTAVTVGLIDSTLKEPLPTPEQIGMTGCIPVKATLVLVPPHLMNQWPSEIHKFTGNRLKVEVVKTVGDLGRLTVEQLQDADVVVAASSLFRSAKYFERLAALSGSDEGLVKAKTASHFASCYAKAMNGLNQQVSEIQSLSSGPAKVWEVVQHSRETWQANLEAAPELLLSKRLKGKQLLEATNAKENGDQANAAESSQEMSAPLPKKSKPETAAQTGSDEKVEERKWKVNKMPPKWFLKEYKPRGWTAWVDCGGEKQYRSADGCCVGTTAKSCEEAMAALSKESSAPQSKRCASKIHATQDSMDSSQTTTTKRGATRSTGAKGVKFTAAVEQRPPSKRKRSAPASVYNPTGRSKRSTKKPTVDNSESDYIASAPEAEEECSVEELVSSEDEAPKKAKRKPAGKQAAAGGVRSNDLDDPWGISSKEVQADWKQMRSPPLEMFYWSRVVVDEFTYLNNFDRVAIQTGVKATARWVLSGTPPHETFEDIKSISSFLGIYLGCSDGKPLYTKSEQTKAQTFQFYRDVHTEFSVKLVPVERAIYLELDHHLQALEMKGGRRKMWKPEGSWRAASHFDLTGNSNSAVQACREIVSLREEQLERCKSEITEAIAKGLRMLDSIRTTKPDYGQEENPSQDVAVSFLRWIQLTEGAEASTMRTPQRICKSA
eukprot:jgi/Tetstr1/447039/TSEL_034496.t1